MRIAVADFFGLTFLLFCSPKADAKIKDMPFKLKIKAMTKPIMETPNILSQKLQELFLKQQQQGLNFLETITTKYNKTQLPKTTRIAGLYQGQG